MAAKEAGGRPIIVNKDPLKEMKFHAEYAVASLIELPDLIQRFVINLYTFDLARRTLWRRHSNGAT